MSPMLFALAALAPAQGLEWVQANYTKYEYRIPMRDGPRLFTAVYVPKDTSKRWPILLNRTPYTVRPYGADRHRTSLGPSEKCARDLFLFAYQDVRGRGRSEGEFVNVRPRLPAKGPREIDETTDTWDTIEWLLRNVPGHNGRVGLWGISYPGFYASMGAIDAHPALKCSSPQAPVTDWFIGDDFHHNGAFFLPHGFNFFASFGRPRTEPPAMDDPQFRHGTPDGYRFFLDLGPLRNADERLFRGGVPFWKELMEHGSYDDFWKARDVRPHLRDVQPAVLTVGGWFDAEDLFGALETYRAIERQSPGTSNRLVMGPWSHGGWARGDGDALGFVRFHAKTARFFQEEIEFPFFRRHLKETDEPELPEAFVFETGRNQWRRHDAWPPRQTVERTFWFRERGRLAHEPPADEQGFDEYPSDPAKPVPSYSGIHIGMAREYMVDDQRQAARRPDVVVYQTEPLEEDVTLAGPIGADLHVSTTGTDSDWVVKLIDVYPDDFPDPDPNPTGVRMAGFQQLVRGEPMRGKFRNGFDKPEPFEPGKPARVAFTMPDVYHTFRNGHQIMVQVHSTWFPLVDRNPQKFCDIYAATEADFQKTTQRVLRSRGAASALRVRVLEAEKVPGEEKTR